MCPKWKERIIENQREAKVDHSCGQGGRHHSHNLRSYSQDIGVLVLRLPLAGTEGSKETD